MSTPPVAPSPGTAVTVPARPAPSRGRQDDVFRRQFARLGWGLSAPALILIAAVTIFPIGYAIAMSLTNVSATGAGFSLSGFTGHNYSVMFGAAQWRYALFFTVLYTVITVAV